MDEREYLRSFDRVNLSDISSLDVADGTTLVLLGDEVRRHFNLPKVFLHPIERNGIYYRQIPHPSGVNHFYNDHAMRSLVGQMLNELVP